MNLNLDPLESKLDQVLALCRRQGDAARRLRQQVAELEAEKQALTGRIATACERLEALKAKLPQD